MLCTDAPKADALPDCATPRHPDGPKGITIFGPAGQPGDGRGSERSAAVLSGSGSAVPKKSRKMFAGRSRVETIEQKRERIANRKRELARERSACGRPVRRKGPQRPKVSAIPDLERWDIERLWSHVERREPDECWPWTAAKSGFGYGRFKVAGKLYSPHRLIYALHHGPIANAQERHGSVVMHECDNPACCNPDHLSLGRQVENVADMIAKGRRGRTGPSSTTAEQGA